MFSLSSRDHNIHVNKAFLLYHPTDYEWRNSDFVQKRVSRSKILHFKQKLDRTMCFVYIIWINSWRCRSKNKKKWITRLVIWWLCLVCGDCDQWLTSTLFSRPRFASDCQPKWSLNFRISFFTPCLWQHQMKKKTRGKWWASLS